MKLLSDGLGQRFSVARLALCVILVAAAIGGLATPVQADGGATHHEIVDRAYNAINTNEPTPTLRRC